MALKTSNFEWPEAAQLYFSLMLHIHKQWGSAPCSQPGTKPDGRFDLTCASVMTEAVQEKLSEICTAL